jgi:hypothetical protein
MIRLRLALLLVFLAAAGNTACTTCPKTCAELKAAADAQHCPERLVETVVSTFEPVDPGEPPPAPPITTAAVPDGATEQEALQAGAADLKASRQWGFILYHKWKAWKAAYDDWAATHNGGTE